ncbi:hypothetical protein FE810_16020 [Thalassotalea litorea]|uniref:Uncharacterized protein n=1 Tax=Thalassotalea litorea TaxID=2020715 RepID=A0A5R9IBN0_9GAMM|nr:hypothetical protein FE810_16020 [Thalassotalea litorea]
MQNQKHANVRSKTKESNHIHVVNSSNKGSHQGTVFHVNGTTFTWEQLNKEQQQQLIGIEKKLKESEQQLTAQTDGIEQIAKQIEVKAKEIEQQARKMETATIKIELEEMSYRELEGLQHKLETATRQFEKIIREKEQELRAIEGTLPEIDQKHVQAIEAQAREYEAALVVIAKAFAPTIEQKVDEAK